MRMRLSAFLLVSLAFPVYGHDIFRGVPVGANCADIIEAENELASSLRRDSKDGLIGFEAIVSKESAIIIYRCTENYWEQVMHIGSFNQDAAHKMFSELRNSVSKVAGKPCQDTNGWPWYKKLFAYIQLGDDYEYLVPTAYWKAGEYDAQIIITKTPPSLGGGENKTVVLSRTRYSPGRQPDSIQIVDLITCD